MRALKVTVIAMGVVLVVGFVVLATLMVRQAAGPGGAGSAEGPVFVLPDDARVYGVAATDGVVVVHWIDGAGRDHLVSLDPATGRTLRVLGREEQLE